MTIARRAAWLGGCAMALVPQITTGNTSQTRLTIGATVVTPCRIGMAGSPSCSGSDSQIASLATKDGPALNPPAARSVKVDSATDSVKFVEVSF